MKRAPTYYGPMSFRIRSEVGQGRISAQIDPPRRNPYSCIRLRLRHPDKAPMKSATVNGKEWNDFDPDTETIILRPGDGKLEVIADY